MKGKRMRYNKKRFAVLTKVWRKPGRLCAEIDPMRSPEARGGNAAKQTETAAMRQQSSFRIERSNGVFFNKIRQFLVCS